MARGNRDGGPARARCNMCGFLSEQRRLSTRLSAERPTGFCCGCATHRLHRRAARASLARKAMGQRLEARGVLIPAAGDRASGRAARLVRAGDPGEGLVGFAAARTRANRSTCPRTGFALKRRSPRWAALRAGDHAPHRRGRPGWVLRFTRDDEEASGSAERLHQGFGLRPKHRVRVRPRRRRVWTRQRVRPPAP